VVFKPVWTSQWSLVFSIALSTNHTAHDRILFLTTAELPHFRVLIGACCELPASLSGTEAQARDLARRPPPISFQPHGIVYTTPFPTTPTPLGVVAERPRGSSPAQPNVGLLRARSRCVATMVEVLVTALLQLSLFAHGSSLFLPSFCGPAPLLGTPVAQQPMNRLPVHVHCEER